MALDEATTAPDAAPAVVPEHDRAAHLQAVQRRLAEGKELWVERATIMASRSSLAARASLLEAAKRAQTVSQRVFWLRRGAELVAEAARGLTACENGCSSCCNIGVSVSAPEAHRIGLAIGRTPAKLGPEQSVAIGDFGMTREGLGAAAARIGEDADSRVGTPCTFLTGGRCSIYEHRPISCRLQINVDVDDLLCRLVPGEAIPVPYLDTRTEKVAAILVLGANARIADIRDWFPPLP